MGNVPAFLQGNPAMTSCSQVDNSTHLGAFVPCKMYKCTYANPKAKKVKKITGRNRYGQAQFGFSEPRFTVGQMYPCVCNDSAGDSRDVPPCYLIDNTGRLVNCGSDAKLKSKFELVS